MNRILNLNILLTLILIIMLSSGCYRSDKLTPEGMVIIPAGEFIMGSNKIDKEGNSKKFYSKKPFYLDEHPERRIFLDDYYIDRYEVTNSQYRRLNPEHRFPQWKENHPVVLINWYEAVQYCRWLGKRLPTEAEWEKAARGIDGREFPWGNEFDASRVNIGMGNKDTTPVGSYENGKSPYGVYDMAGNVWEWTADWYKAYPGSDYNSKEFGEKFKVIRGGARVSSGHYNLPYFVRSAHRLGVPPENRAADTGFRCVKDK